MDFRPWTNACMAAEGVSFHDLAKSSALMLATLANASRESPPLATAPSMSDMVLLIAVPAASLFWPVAAMAVAHASTCGVLMPTMPPSEPMRLVTSMIADSWAGMLLPRRTKASPKAE